MKRIVSIFTRDLKNSLRDNILLYSLVAPIILALIFKFFIPNAQSAALQFAVHSDISTEVVEEFEKYGEVEMYSSMKEIEDRVNEIDDLAGIKVDTEDNYSIILQGNESHDVEVIPKMIMRDILQNKKIDINYKVSDIGYRRIPMALYGAISLILTSILVGGFVIGFNVIEEKESGTIKALNVTPMRKYEFIIGRSIIGILVPIIHVYVILWVFDMLDVNWAMLLAMTIVSSLIGILIGFFIGIISPNQISGMANLKGTFLLVTLAILGGILLPKSKQFLLYWAPPYWSLVGYRDILLDKATWIDLLGYIGWILGLSFLIFMLLRKKIKRGLA